MEVKTIERNNLLRTIKLLENIESLLPPVSSVKCLVDEDGKYQFSRNGIAYLMAHAGNDWVVDTIMNHASMFDEKYGYGSVQFLAFVKLLARVSHDAVEQDVPSHISSRILTSFIRYVSKTVFQKYTKQIVKNIPNEVRLLTAETRNLSVNKTSSFSVKYSRYSRHNFEEVNKSSAEKVRLRFEKAIETQINQVCQSKSDMVCKLLLQLLRMKTKREITDPTENNLEFDHKNINIERVLNVNFQQSSVCSGIALNIKDAFDIAMATRMDVVTFVLVDLDFYGGALPKQEHLKLKEEVSVEDLHNNADTPTDIMHKFCINYDVNLIIVHGNIPNDVRLKFWSCQILIINCNHAKMSQFSKLFSCKICYGVDKLTPSHIVKDVSSRLLYNNEKNHSEDKRYNYKQTPPAYFVLDNLTSAKTYYSVFVCGRTVDLLDLSFEEFTESLKNINDVFSEDGYVENPYLVYNDIMTSCKNTLDFSKEYAYKPWQAKDLTIFRRPVLDVLYDYLENFIKAHACHVTPVSKGFLKDLLSYSQDCVVEIMNTRELPLHLEQI